MSEIVSIREFGRRVGVSDTAIRKAIDAGKIVRAIGTNPNNGRPTLDYYLALEEWKVCGGGIHAVNYEAKPQPAKAQKQPAAKPEPAPAAYTSAPPAQPPVDTGTLVAAKRAQAVYIAKIKELEYKRMAGTLVEKDKVYQSLFAFGQEVRNAFQALPDRIIDEIRASQNRNEAHKLLYDSIADVLDKLSAMDEKLKNS
jgi:hypothetical protein